MDYIYAIDADMEFLSVVGEEILGDLVGTRHWGYLDKPGSYSGNKKSTAYVKESTESIIAVAPFMEAKALKCLSC